MSSFERLLCRPMLLMCVAYIGGILGYYSGALAGGMILCGLLLLAAGMLLIFAYFGQPDLRKKSGKAETLGTRLSKIMSYAVVWLSLPLFSLTGFMRTAEAEAVSPLKGYLERGQGAIAYGTVDFISIREDGYCLTLDKSIAHIGQNSYEADGILVYCDFDIDTEPKIGKKIIAEGKIYPCEAARNDGNFDADRYYSNRGIDARMYADVVISQDEYVPNIIESIEQGLFAFRFIISNGIRAVLPEKEAGVLISILTGDRGLLDSELKDLYSRGGIAHILSISALHVSLIGMGLFGMLMKVLGRLKLSVLMTVATMVLYGLLTGFSVSTARAVFMLTVSLIGLVIGKAYDLLSALSFSALILLMYEPGYLLESGFQMSFTAVLGVYLASQVIEMYEIKSRVVSSLIVSAMVQLMLCPVLMNTYYYLNPYSVLINLLVIPLMPVVLMAGAPAGLIGSLTYRLSHGAVGASYGLLSVLGRFFAGPVYYVLKLYERICDAETELPGSNIVTGAPDKRAVVVYYAVILITYYALRGSRQRRAANQKRKASFAPALLLGICCIIFIRMPKPDLYAAMLDVGQGDSIYVEVPGKSILFDGGSSNISKVGKYRIIPFLKYHGVRELDCIVVSHTDSDHISGILEILEEGYPKVKLLILGANYKELSEEESEIIQLAMQKNVPIQFVKAGDCLMPEEKSETFDNYGVHINIIAPEDGMSYKDANEASVVAELTVDSFSMLLTGDSGFASEEMYVNYLSRKSYSVLKCAHHGSKNSTSATFLERTRPVVTLISCSKYNSYNHPNPFLLDRLSEAKSSIYTTPDSGMISIEYITGSNILRLRKLFASRTNESE